MEKIVNLIIHNDFYFFIFLGLMVLIALWLLASEDREIRRRNRKQW